MSFKKRKSLVQDPHNDVVDLSLVHGVKLASSGVMLLGQYGRILHHVAIADPTVATAVRDEFTEMLLTFNEGGSYTPSWLREENVKKA